jgi:NAD(P)H-hydrate epimerase
MLKLVSSAEMALIDRKAENDFLMPSILLMENAGIKAVHFLVQTAWKGSIPDGLFVFLAGRGNNSGDAFVMARQFMMEGKHELVIILADGTPELESLPGVNLEICRSLGIPIIDYKTSEAQSRDLLSGSLFIFDGLTGTGLSGEIKEPLKSLIGFINTLPQPKIAIDVPSGVSDEFQNGFVALKADLTLTMGLPKRCLYLPAARPFSGTIVTIEIGFPPQLVGDPVIQGELLQARDFFSLLPPLAPESYKGTRGHLAVFAGTRGTTGAAALAAQAAGRARTGLVTLYTDPDAYPVIAAQLSSIMCRPVTKETTADKKIVGQYDALLIGPGFGLTVEKRSLFQELYAIPLPKVIDADGLTILSTLQADELPAANAAVILTPHPGECARLAGKSAAAVLSDPLETALSVSKRFQAVCVLKSHVTFITEPAGRYAVIDGMNPALGTGGSGDVLSGIIAGFLSQGIEAYTSARLGVLLHAKLGEYVFSQKGWFLAEDLLPYISLALSCKEENEIWQ